MAADLSTEGLKESKPKSACEKVMAEEALAQFEVELGLRSPETTRCRHRQGSGAGGDQGDRGRKKLKA